MRRMRRSAYIRTPTLPHPGSSVTPPRLNFALALLTYCGLGNLPGFGMRAYKKVQRHTIHLPISRDRIFNRR